MHCAIPFLAALACFLPAITARNSHRSVDPSVSANYRRNAALTNRRLPGGNEAGEFTKRGGTKYVFMHHIVGNTFPYTSIDWIDDIRSIQAKGVDALALNIGRSDWQRVQVASAYSAAASLGTNFKLFYSFDFTEMDCNLDDFVARVNQYANHPNQFKINGRPMISSFSGDCLGNAGWVALKERTNGYLMPFLWNLENHFNDWPSLDSWQCWGCAWPGGNYAKNTNDDYYYINQLGARYAATVSPWFYAHYGYKNNYFRGDDWLFNDRWEQLISMRDTLTFVELATWNDYGESSYLGPTKGAQPDGTTWTNGFPHTAWHDMSEYYIFAFKNGYYPAITNDVVYFWARPHPRGASALGDGLGKPLGWDWAEDSMWAVVFATSTSTVLLKCGSSSQKFTVDAGVKKLKIALSPGKMTVQMVKGGQTVIDYTPNDFTYTNNPVLYNYNAWVGSATATRGSSSSFLSATRTSSSASSTSAPPSASTASSATTTAGGLTWRSLGCFQDSDPRVLNNGPFADGALTISKCLVTCGSKGMIYAGVENGVECFCSDTMSYAAVKASESECSKPCGGGASEKCGGGRSINIYKVIPAPTSSSSTSPSPTPTTTSWSNYGCVADGTTGTRRALTAASYSRPNMTPQLCQNLCVGYQYAGVEYGTNCYCGNTLTNNGATGNVISPSNCQTSCGGDATQKCGGGQTLNVYTKVVSTQWSSAGCYVDGPTRLLRGSYVSQNGLTTERCIDLCKAGGYTMAATEYGKECLCGSQLFKQGGAGVLAPSKQCNVPCGGNSAQMCGAGWRVNLYLKPCTVIT